MTFNNLFTDIKFLENFLLVTELHLTQRIPGSLQYCGCAWTCFPSPASEWTWQQRDRKTARQLHSHLPCYLVLYISHLSVALVKHHSQGGSQKGGLIWAKGLAGQAEQQVGMVVAGEAAEPTHPLPSFTSGLDRERVHGEWLKVLKPERRPPGMCFFQQGHSS